MNPYDQPRTITAPARANLDVRSLVLLAILLAAGFILNFTVGKAISALSAGMISPEFIVSAFCLAILLIRPTLRQALAIGIMSAAIIQLTTTSPLIDFAAEGAAAVAMALIVRLGMRGRAADITPLAGTFVTTMLSGVIFMCIKKNGAGGRGSPACGRHAARGGGHRRLQRPAGASALPTRSHHVGIDE